MKRLILLAGKVVFVTVFLVVAGGFLAWEIRGLVRLGTDREGGVAMRGGEAGLVAEAEAAGMSGEVSDLIVAEDARPLVIARYLEKYHSPLLPYSDLIFQLSQSYGIGFDWVLAIGQQESNLCKKIPEDSYNCWGYGINSKGTLRFESYEAALKSYYEYLQREYFAKGLDTEELIMRKYCPHSNGSWAYGVKHFREEINSGIF